MESMRWRILYRVASLSKRRCSRLFLPNNAAPSPLSLHPSVTPMVGLAMPVCLIPGG